MATIKSFTSVEQSCKLAEILPLESADMHWQDASKEYENPYGIYDRHFRLVAGNSSKIINNKHDFRKGFILPAWSLAALMNYLKEVDYFPKIQANEYEITMSIDYQDKDEDEIYTINIYAESFVDACYEMILKLNELKML